MRAFKIFVILFSSSCYSVEWGGCKLNAYFYTSPIESLDVYFHSPNKLSIDFEKGNTYWGVSLFKIYKDGSNKLLKRNNLSSSEVGVERVVYENYTRLLEQDLFYTVKKAEGFKVATVPVTFGYSINAIFDSKVNETQDVLNFSIAVQEYEEYILFTRIVITSDGGLPSVLDVREVVQQFRNSCTIYDV